MPPFFCMEREFFRETRLNDELESTWLTSFPEKLKVSSLTSVITNVASIFTSRC